MILRIVSFALLMFFNSQVYSQVVEPSGGTAKKVYKTTKKAAQTSTQKKTYTSNELQPPSKVTIDFFKAYNSGNLEIAELFLKQGADINCPNCNDAGITPLINTAQNPILSKAVNPNLPWLVSHGANVNAKNKQGETALMKSIKGISNDYYSGMYDTLFLINNGSKTDIKDKSGKNTLHHLAKNGVVPIGAGGYYLDDTKAMNARYETTAQNILTSGTNINEQDLVGNSVLMYAASTCNPSSVNFYISNGADKNLKNSKGETAAQIVLDKAVTENSKFCNEVVSILNSGL